MGDLNPCELLRDSWLRSELAVLSKSDIKSLPLSFAGLSAQPRMGVADIIEDWEPTADDLCEPECAKSWPSSRKPMGSSAGGDGEPRRRLAGGRFGKSGAEPCIT